MELNKKTLNDSKKQLKIWTLKDKILYDLCRDYPFHKNDEEIAAKIMIIGRVYAAAIERGRGKRFKNNYKFYRRGVIPKIRESGIDKWLKDLGAYKSIDENNIAKILKYHKKVSDLFNSLGSQNRSLSSKYLHFHNPRLFFLYDTSARKSLSKLGLDKEEEVLVKKYKKMIEEKKNKVDKEYTNYFIKAFVVRKRIGMSVSTREFDRIMIYLDNK